MAVGDESALFNLLVSVMNAREQADARVSRILHDELGQVLSAIGLQLDLLRMDISEDPQEATRRIAAVQEVLEQAVAQVRDLSYELNPSIVERTGLQFALDRLVGRFRRDFAGSLRFFYDSSLRVPVEPATAMFKIAEQALDNAVQHAHCSHIELMVKPARDSIVLEVRDNGAGFPMDPAKGVGHGLGLHIMKYQAGQAGLRFSVASAPEKGTIVRAIYRVKEPLTES